MKYLAFLISTLLSAQAIASTCETNYPIVDECYETRGRLQAANDNPKARIWKVGTNRVLGVKNKNLEFLPKIARDVFTFEVYVFADYQVCPLTIDKPGRMQMVCVESMKNIRIEDYRENPDVPVITKIQNESVSTKIQSETEKTHVVEPPLNGTAKLISTIVILVIVLVLFFFLRAKRKTWKLPKTNENVGGYQEHDELLRRKQRDINVGSDRFNRASSEKFNPMPRDNSRPQNNVETAHKKKAKSEAVVKQQINSFPEVTVEHIIDGDTVIVVKNWQQIRIRLDSIDCPEGNQHWGDTAKYGLIKLIGGRKIRLEEHGIDSYERTLATIYVQDNHASEWVNVNERMVTLGHAWVMRRFYGHLPKDRKDKLNRLERWAKSKKVGLWQTPNPIPPWQWRSKG